MNYQGSHIIKEFINDTKKILKDNLIQQYLFGSYAKNTQDESSDIDILLIVKKLNPELRKKISSLSSAYSLNKDVIISPVIKEKSIWKKNKKFNTLFYKEIEEHGVVL